MLSHPSSALCLNPNRTLSNAPENPECVQSYKLYLKILCSLIMNFTLICVFNISFHDILIF
jgi:hypothetical protein